MYALSWVHLQLAIYPILLVIVISSVKLKAIQLPTIPKDHKTACLVVLILSFIFSLQMILNGNIGNSIFTFGDDMAHLGYISELKHAFPPQHPGFAGIPLRGYHFFADFVTANVSNTTGLSFLPLERGMVLLLQKRHPRNCRTMLWVRISTKTRLWFLINQRKDNYA
jgi:hypothetical protein